MRGVLLGTTAALGVATVRELGKVFKGEKSAEDEIAEKTGIDLNGISERHNFSAEMQVDNGGGPYIIHIGQVHEHPTDKTTAILSEGEVMGVQKDVEGIVGDILQTKKTSNKVFCEGFDDKIVSQLPKLVELRAKTMKLKGAEDFNWLADEALMEANDVFVYIYFQRLEKMAEEFKRNPPEFAAGGIGEALAKEAGVKGTTEREKFARNMAMVQEE